MYNILHDNHKPIMIVGNTDWNKEIYHGVPADRRKKIISIEEFETMEDKSNYQYIVTGVDTSFKKTVIEKIKSAIPDVNFISMVSESAHVHLDTKIGVNTVLAQFVSVPAPISIGDHCHICPYTTLGHVETTTIHDYCFIGPYTSVVGCDLGMGTWCGHHCMFLKIQTQPWSQFFMESRVTRHTFTESGTFKNSKKLRDDNSLTGSLKT